MQQSPKVYFLLDRLNFNLFIFYNVIYDKNNTLIVNCTNLRTLSMKKLTLFIFLCNTVSFTMQPSGPSPLDIPKRELSPLCFDCNARLAHVVQNNAIVSILFVTGSEYTRTYIPGPDGYKCVYSGSILPCRTPINPEIAKQLFSSLITQYGLKDKSIPEILARCVLTKK